MVWHGLSLLRPHLRLGVSEGNLKQARRPSLRRAPLPSLPSPEVHYLQHCLGLF